LLNRRPHRPIDDDNTFPKQFLKRMKGRRGHKILDFQ
jgi:hypothetical protein